MNAALVDEYLRTLKLPGALLHYRRLAEKANDPVAYLGEVLAAEIEQRHERGIKRRIAASRLPTLKTLEGFDFTLQPNVPKLRILELADGAFVTQQRNLVLYGPPGTGKTHCLIAIGLAACTTGYPTFFTTAAGLLTSLLDAKRDGTLARKLRWIDRFALLLIDELGYVPFEREATDLLFQVISQRYERASIAITTNLAFEQWTQIFPDAMAVAFAAELEDRPMVDKAVDDRAGGGTQYTGGEGGEGAVASSLAATPVRAAALLRAEPAALAAASLVSTAGGGGGSSYVESDATNVHLWQGWKSIKDGLVVIRW